MTVSQEITDVSNETIEAFYLMWDSFPHPVMLLVKCRDIVAANKKAKEMGVPIHGRCYQLGAGSGEIHAGCKANEALEEGVAKRTVRFNKDTKRVMDAYWLPITSEKDLYLHFGINIDITEYIKSEISASSTAV